VTELVPAELGPGLVPTGFAEHVLAQALSVSDPARLWDAVTTLAGEAQKWNGFSREKNEIKSAQMFCEIELGQRLGPPPGQGARTDLAENLPHAESLLPAQRLGEFRRYYGHRDYLLDLVREGKRSRRALLLAVDQAEAADRPEPREQDLDIRRGDFRDVLGDIDPDSVALILTDPPYPAEYLPLWDALGLFAAKALADGGSLIAYCGQSILPDAFDRLRPHLRYWWTIALSHSAGSQMLPGKFVSVGWKPLLWFVRERRANDAFVPDRLTGSPPRKGQDTGDDGTWAQGVGELEPVISALTAPGDLIVDPFAGSGSTGLAATRFGRRFVGAEIGRELCVADGSAIVAERN
jgi:DNA methylase